MNIKKQIIIACLLSTTAVSGGCDLFGNKRIQKVEVVEPAEIVIPAANTQETNKPVANNQVSKALEVDTAAANNQDGDKTGVKKQPQNKLDYAEKDKNKPPTYSDKDDKSKMLADLPPNYFLSMTYTKSHPVDTGAGTTKVTIKQEIFTKNKSTIKPHNI
ncbi:MAG: hypothetical protein EU981_02870 [Candidatus Liberibacter ctenarytainae]|uniref:Lipoprotein n=1 Tax=Candidatus Liberibacter ctenarytainae TaxID=2020335 RepID=A0A937AC41_9HYPH|nr:hypothetical protein [Candidatus Liberibacter ctenarytainae]